MTLDEILQANQDVLIRLKEQDDEYYREHFKESLKKDLTNLKKCDIINTTNTERGNQ